MARRTIDPARTRILRTLLVGDDGWLPVYGGEAVRLEGEVIGRLRSVAYGPTIDRMIGYALLPVSIALGTALTVDVFAESVRAVAAADVQVDPAGDRMRA